MGTINRKRVVSVPNVFLTIRLKLGFTQKEFAELMSTSQQAISLYEQGKRIPGARTTRKYLIMAEKAKVKVKLEDIRCDYSSNVVQNQAEGKPKPGRGSGNLKRYSSHRIKIRERKNHPQNKKSSQNFSISQEISSQSQFKGILESGIF